MEFFLWLANRAYGNCRPGELHDGLFGPVSVSLVMGVGVLASLTTRFLLKRNLQFSATKLSGLIVGASLVHLVTLHPKVCIGRQDINGRLQPLLLIAYRFLLLPALSFATTAAMVHLATLPAFRQAAWKDLFAFWRLPQKLIASPGTHLPPVAAVLFTARVVAFAAMSWKG